MDLELFVQRLGRLSGDELRSIALRVRDAADPVDGLIRGWKTTLLVDRAIRARHAGYAATIAGRRASEAVGAAADRACLGRRDPDAVRVARLAREVARGMVAGPVAQAFIELEARECGLLDPTGASPVTVESAA